MTRDGSSVWEEEWSGSECLAMEGGRRSNERDLRRTGFAVDSSASAPRLHGAASRAPVVGPVLGPNPETDRIRHWDVTGGCQWWDPSAETGLKCVVVRGIVMTPPPPADFWSLPSLSHGIRYRRFAVEFLEVATWLFLFYCIQKRNKETAL